MATFTNLDQEKIAGTDKYEQRKANTLGADKSYVEEPFGNSEIILRNDIFSETPTSDTSFASPEYGDWPNGAVASRRQKIRLHSLATSGISGLSSIQTFVAVSSTPASDNPEDIESVRIKHIVPPDLSMGKANAAHADPNFRGFELALFPAYSVTDASSPTGSSLDAYDGYGSIPITADPTAEYGIGNDARWTVDYANGIIRFTDAPLNGVNSIMNPFRVYGDIDGYERPEDEGRLTMFATFYQYIGPTLIDNDDVNIVTVGDGINSFGTYYGQTSTVMQMAVDSLSPYGGTIYLKEGDYVYTSTVNIPDNVVIIGLSKRAEITRPDSLSAFSIQGSNVSISGLTIKTSGSTNERAAIEIITNSSSQTIQNVKIENNELWATHDAYGIGIAPKHSNATYKNIDICDNIFDSPSFDRPVYIGNYIIDGLSTTPSVSIDNINITSNNFKISESAVDGYAIYFESGISDGGILENIREIHIIENNIALTADIGLDIDTILENVHIYNNSEFRNIYINGLSGSTIKDNVFNDIHLDGYIVDSQFNNNIINSFSIYDSVSDFNFIGNTCFGKTVFKADDATSDWEINNVNISSNKFHDDLDISGSLHGFGQHNIKNLIVDNNSVTSSINFATSANFTGGNITYSDLKVTDNIIGDANTTIVDSINFGDDAYVGIYLSACIFSDNIIHGNIVFNERVYLDSDTAGVELIGNTFVGSKGIYWYSHKLHNISISNNRINHIDLFYDVYPGDSADGSSSDIIIIKDNIMMSNSNITLHDMTANSSGFTLQGCTIENNVFDTTGSISVMESIADTNDYTFEDLSVSGNKLVAGSIAIGGTLDSDSNFNDLSIKNNWVYGGSITTAAATGNRMQVSNNYISSNLVLNGDTTNTIIVDNVVLGAIDINGDLDETTIATNKAGSSGFDFAGTIDNSIISDNTSSGKVELHGACDESKINNNRIEGDFTILGISNSTVDSNSILGSSGVSSTTWSNTIFSNNEIENNLNVSTSVSNSVFGNNTVRGNITSVGDITKSTVTGLMVTGTFGAGAVASTKIDSNTIGNTSITGHVVQITGSISDSSISNNTILRDSTNTGIGGISISGSVSSSCLNGNSCSGDLIISGTLGSHSTLSNNNARSFNLSTTNYSSVMGNVVDSDGYDLTPYAALIVGDLTNVVCSDNIFRSISTTADISIGNCSDVTFSGNIIFSESSQKITFGDIIRTEISDCKFVSGSVEVTSMVSSSIDNSILNAGFTIPSLAGTLLNNSFITNTEIDGAVSLTNSGTDAMFLNSTFDCNILTNTSSNAFVIRSGDKIFEKSHFNSNTVIGAVVMDVDGDSSGHYWLLDSTFCDNIFTSGLECLGVNSASYATYVLDSVISNNQFDGYLSIGTDLNTTTSGNLFNNVVFDSNRVGSYFNLGPSDRTIVTYQNSVISNNSFGNTISISGSMAGCSMSNNVVKDNVAIGTLSGTVMSGNMIGSDGAGNLTLSGLSQNSICVSNIINGTFEVDDSVEDGYVSSSNIIGNTINSTFTIDGAITDAIIDNNNIVGVSTISGTLSDSSFSSNHSASTVTFSSPLDSCVINNNVIDDSSDLVFSGAVGGTASSGCVISNNRCNNLNMNGDCDYVDIISNYVNGTFTLSASTKEKLSIVGNKFNVISASAAPLSNSTVGNNIIDSTVGLNSLTNCVLDGNIFSDNVTISGNVSRSVIENNIMSGISGYISITLSGTFTDSMFSDNQLYQTLSFTYSSGNSIVRSTISSNNIYGAIQIADRIYDSVISDNVVYGNGNNTSLEEVYYSVISNNKFEDTVDITGDIYNSNITGNNFSGSTDALDFLSSLVSTTFSSNYIENIDFTGTLYDCVVADNIFASVVNFDATSTSLQDCTISCNQFDDTVTIDGDLVRCIVTGNQMASTLSLNDLNIVSITSNVFNAAFNSSSWTDVSCSGNTFNSTASAGSNTITESSIGNNIFNSTFTSGKWTDVACNGNSFNSSLTVTDTGTTTACITRVAFQGNNCKGLIHFAKTGEGTADNFIHSTFSGNVFQTGLALGSSGVANEHTLSLIHI